MTREEVVEATVDVVTRVARSPDDARAMQEHLERDLPSLSAIPPILGRTFNAHGMPEKETAALILGSMLTLYIVTREDPAQLFSQDELPS